MSSCSVGSRLMITNFAPLRFAISGNPAAGHTTSDEPIAIMRSQSCAQAVARAIVTRPRLVLADEPTANLDSENSRMVVELMREMNREHKVTFVFTTHDPRLLDHVDRRILLRDGSIERDEQMEALEAA